jgi:uncharacterized glyoxalase superfamily protein PhnB
MPGGEKVEADRKKGVRAMRTIYALVRYNDPGAAMEWLVKVLSFEVHEMSKNDDGQVAHAELSIGEDMIMIGQGKPGGPGIYLAIEDPDAHHDRVVRAGAEITAELDDKPYGSREYACQDPEGNNWYFGTYRP